MIKTDLSRLGRSYPNRVYDLNQNLEQCLVRKKIGEVSANTIQPVSDSIVDRSLSPKGTDSRFWAIVAAYSGDSSANMQADNQEEAINGVTEELTSDDSSSVSEEGDLIQTVDPDTTRFVLPNGIDVSSDEVFSYHSLSYHGPSVLSIVKLCFEKINEISWEKERKLIEMNHLERKLLVKTQVNGRKDELLLQLEKEKQDLTQVNGWKDELLLQLEKEKQDLEKALAAEKNKSIFTKIGESITEYVTSFSSLKESIPTEKTDTERFFKRTPMLDVAVLTMVGLTFIGTGYVINKNIR